MSLYAVSFLMGRLIAEQEGADAEQANMVGIVAALMREPVVGIFMARELVRLGNGTNGRQEVVLAANTAAELSAQTLEHVTEMQGTLDQIAQSVTADDPDVTLQGAIESIVAVNDQVEQAIELEKTTQGLLEDIMDQSSKAARNATSAKTQATNARKASEKASAQIEQALEEIQKAETIGENTADSLAAHREVMEKNKKNS